MPQPPPQQPELQQPEPHCPNPQAEKTMTATAAAHKMKTRRGQVWGGETGAPKTVESKIAGTG
jgi:hypothetical protein